MRSPGHAMPIREQRLACRRPSAASCLLLVAAIIAAPPARAADALSWPDAQLHGVALVGWSAAGASATDAALDAPGAPPGDLHLPVGGDGTFRRLTLKCPQAGTLALSMDCPRALKAWVGDHQVLDEPLSWRDPQRRVQAVLLLPVGAGPVELTIEVGPRSRHPQGIDNDSPSRNRARVMEMVARMLPDVLTVSASLQQRNVPACTLRFAPGQYRRAGVAYQEVVVHPAGGAVEAALPALSTPLGAGRQAGRTPAALRCFVPVVRGDLPPLRAEGVAETRPEPLSQIAALSSLSIGKPGEELVIGMPIYEGHGRLAPEREFRTLAWPSADDLLAQVPEPVLPARYADFLRLYRRSWQMVLELVRSPAPESGLPNDYVGTAKKSFMNEMFMWDSCFTAMAYAYGWRSLPVTATLDCLYSYQQDGGYISRESDVHTGLPLLYEPDFSPNPPMPAVAEVALARLTGDVARLRRAYPVLVGYHRWLDANRRLEDGTYWTTGLANGLDNSPSLGEGYPDLTAQMAHAAESLGIIAAAIGKSDEAKAWHAEHDAIAAACNAHLWSPELRFYSTSLPGGGHNPNKVVTGFWPLWAGIVPPDRVADLARHLLDPTSFWRLHPVPSLAADSPRFQPGGAYWLGSVWAPTNTAVVKGFQRVGRMDLARQVTVKHLQCMLQAYDATGVIWENYCSEKPERGSQSGPDYSWSISGPIRLLIETLLGIEADALTNSVRWTPIPGETMGLKRLAMGEATISLLQSQEGGRDIITVDSDQPFTLVLVDSLGNADSREIGSGRTRIAR